MQANGVGEEKRNVRMKMDDAAGMKENENDEKGIEIGEIG